LAEKRAKMKRPASIADLLDEIFHDKPTGKRLKEGKIWLVWERAVGDQIAARARPSGFRDGKLTVTVDNSPWMQQLTYLKKEIIEKINGNIGEEMVKDIYLKAGNTHSIYPQTPSPQKTYRLLSPEELQLIEERSSGICDPELKESMFRLMSAHLKRN